MKKISPRQLFFFLACIAPVGKLVLMPSRLVVEAKNDLLFPALVGFAVQTGVVFCVLLLAKRGESFADMLAATFGKIAAKVLLCVFAAFLLFAAFLPLLEQKLFVQSAFYDTLPSVVTFAPFFLFSAYLCAKPLGSLGRIWDILAPVSIVGFAGIMLLSVGSADYGALLPAGAAGAGGFWRGLAAAASWFFDGALLLPFLGKIDYRRGTAWKGALAYAAGGVAVLFFLATFYGVFAEIALNQPFAFTKTSKYFSGITVLGRIDYLFSYALALVMAFFVALPVQACVDCVKQAFGAPKYLPAALSVLLNLGLFFLALGLDYRFVEIMQVFAQTLFWIFPVFCVAVPLLCLLLRRSHASQ